MRTPPVVAILLLSRLLMAESDFVLSHEPGAYGQDIDLSIRAVRAGVSVFYQFLSDDQVPTSAAIPALGPIELSAVFGEERSYHLRIHSRVQDQIREEKALEYTIDKRAPSMPALDPQPGEYWGSVQLEFKPHAGEVVFYAVNGNILKQAQQAREPILLEGQASRSVDYFVQAYSVDVAGNRSGIRGASYSVVRRQATLDIVSPVPGIFANHQLLLLHAGNVEWVKYTQDGTDPSAAGTLYVGPQMLSLTGGTQLQVVAKPALPDADLIHRQVTFSVELEDEWSVISDAKSGVYSAGQKVKLMAGFGAKVYYTFNDLTPAEDNLLYGEILSIDSIPSARKVAVLRARSLAADGAGWGGEYRYVLIIDRRVPQKPLISVPRLVSNSAIDVALRVLDQSQISYALNEAQLGVYAGPIRVGPEHAGVEGAATIKAWAINHAQQESEPAIVTIRFDQLSPEPPQIEVFDEAAASVVSEGPVWTRGPLRIRARGPHDSRVVWEITSDMDPPLPDSGSPEAPQEMVFTVPHGAERRFAVRFASLDPAGNLTHLDEPLTFTLDRSPPRHPRFSHAPGPEPLDRETTLILVGEGRVRYEVSEDGSLPQDPDEDSTLYEDGIVLKGAAKRAVTYYLKLVCTDDLDNTTAVLGPYAFTVDRRQPVLPELHGVKDGGVYSSRTVSLQAERAEFDVRYTMTNDGTQPEEPDLDDALLPEALTFAGELGKEVIYHLKLVPTSKSGAVRGEIYDLRFKVDLKPPTAPVLSGFQQGARYNRPVVVGVEYPQPEDTYYLGVSVSENDPPDPVQYGEVLSGSVRFDVPQGTERMIRLRLAAVDRAGNRSPHDGFFKFTIDRQPPVQPALVGVPENGVAREPISIAVAPHEGKVLYEITSDGSVPPVPRDSSPTYLAPIVLSGAEGREVVYRIATRGADELGNLSDVSKIWKIVVDRHPPSQPSAPRVVPLQMPLSGAALLEWDLPTGHELYFRERTQVLEDAEYNLYTGPLEIGETTTFDCYVVDRAGNSSAVNTVTVELPELDVTKPVVHGVVDGVTYNNVVEVTLEAESGIVRYELTADSSEPREIIPSSPLAEGPLVLDAAYDETATFWIRARSHSAKNPAVVSEETWVRFVVDKTPPAAPTIAGIDDGEYYHESKTIQLLSDEGQIYYAIASDGRDPEIPEPATAHLYQKPFTLEARNAEVIEYSVVAYTVDAAGNRSRSVAAWRATFDRSSVYVSTYGDDDHSGTRSKPYRTLERAFEALLASGRKYLRVSHGRYTLNRPMVIDRDVVFDGGLDPFSWNPAGMERKTIIETGKYFQANEDLISVLDGKFNVSSVALRDVTGKCTSLVRVTGGEFRLKDAQLVLENRDEGIAMAVSGGNVRVSDTAFTAANIVRGTFLSVSGGQVRLVGSELLGPSAGDRFTCVAFSGNGEHHITGSALRPGSALDTKGLLVEGATLKVRNSTITSGSGNREAICAAAAKQATLTIEESTIETDAQANYPVAILAEDSSVSVNQSQMLVAGKLGATGIRAKRGSSDLMGTWVRSARTTEFLYLVDIEGKGHFYNNVLLGAQSSDVVSVFLTGSDSDWFNNTIVCGDGADVTTGFFIKGNILPRMINNIIARTGSERGTAVHLVSREGALPILLTNNLSGWQALLRVDQIAAGEATGTPSTVIDDVEGLNGFDRDPLGGNIDGNISESYLKTFRVTKTEDYHLSPFSQCVNGGTHVAGPPYFGPQTDVDREARPAPLIGLKPAFDIGADELY